MKNTTKSAGHGRHFGFSMVELMIVLAIAAILLTLAVPGFASLFGQTRITTGINDLLAAVNMTRSEALSRGIRVDMIPNADDDWRTGWTVFVDSNGDQVVSSGETVISKHEALASDISVDQANPGAAFADPKTGRRYIAFNAAGYSRWNNGGYMAGSIELGNGHARRKLVLSFLGRARTCNPVSDKNCS